MAAFALDAFERQAEAFSRAHSWREYQFEAGVRPGRGLRTLYDDDFRALASTDLFLDLQAASDAQPAQLRRLTHLLACANLEANTRDFAARAGGLEARSMLMYEDDELPWRAAPARWVAIDEAPRRHELAEAWHGVIRTDLNPLLERWHGALRQALQPLTSSEWLTFWADVRGIDLAGTVRLAESLLRSSDDLYAHALGVYFGQLDLPIDDAWVADADWAFRAPRFDSAFAAITRMPVLVRAMRDLGIELESQTALHMEPAAGADTRCLAVSIPDEVYILTRLIGGWRDFAGSLAALGAAQHVLHTDRTLPFWQRALGDEIPTSAYGLLLESLVRDRAWLSARLDFQASDDFGVIAHIRWLQRVRKLAALALYEQRLWQSEPGSALAADFEESLSAATRVRHFRDEYLLELRDAPWSTLRPALALRAEVFAAQLRLWLKREFDEEWWRSSRASHFLIEELWRIGRRYSAEEILGFLGFEGFDPSVLWSDCSEVLTPL